MTILTFTRDLQERAWSALTEHAARFDVAALPHERRREITADGQLWACSSAWFILEAEFGGVNVTDDFIDKLGRFRTRAEIAYLRAMRQSRVRLYEVEAVRVDTGLRVRDSETGEAIDVRERLFTHEAAEGMVVPLRLRDDADVTQSFSPLRNGKKNAATKTVISTTQSSIWTKLTTHCRRFPNDGNPGKPV